MAVGVAVFALSFALLGYEILLMRLLSIVQWHHFAAMIISLALLGIGASGTFVTLFQRWLTTRFRGTFCASAICFGTAMPLCFAAAQGTPLNPLEFFWDPRQWLLLLQTYSLLLLPFFFAGTCLSLAITRFRETLHRIYFFDLLGAGCGGLGTVLLLWQLKPEQCLVLLSALGLASAGLVWLSPPLGRSLLPGLCLIGVAAILPFLGLQDWMSLRLSPYKGLSTALLAPGARLIAERSSPLGWLAVVESPVIPFRHAPGMSLQCTAEPPPQLAVFIDGDAMSPVTRFDGRFEPLAFLDCLTSALPFHLLEHPQVLVLGAGGGMDVLMALSHGARAVDAVELDPNLISLVRDVVADYAGRVYEQPGVAVHTAEARGFVSRSQAHYDCIQVSLIDSFTASAVGGHALNESYLYTVEALGDLYGRLAPGGILSITRWLMVPPRDSLKLFATAVAALERAGVREPGGSLALIRSWKTTTLMVKKGPITPRDRETIQRFCEERSFDIDHCPGIGPEWANRFNMLDPPTLSEGTAAILGAARASYLDRYKFDIEPPTDDRPYFFQDLKWRTIPELLALRSQGGLSLLESTTPLLVVTAIQALMLSLFLILLPLQFLRRGGRVRGGGSRVAMYFAALGCAFLLLEIAFIQKLILFLGHPLVAASVVLTSFLVFAGLGSRFSAAFGRAVSKRPVHGDSIAIGLAAVAVSGLAFANLYLVGLLSASFGGLGEGGRIGVAVALLAPLAFCMGMPFPLGLSRVAEARPEWVPWAWAINGCASVLATVVASLLSIHLGFNAVITLGAGLYALTALVFIKPLSPGP